MFYLADTTISQLRQQFRGDLITEENAQYIGACRIWNGMMDDRRPGLIARPSGVADIMAAVRFARDHDIPLAVRGGGHSAAGKSTLDDGIVLDMGAMRHVRVDPAAGFSHAAGGAQWQDYDHETQPFGVATPGGVISTTGVGGFTLGGGIGWLSRRFGLTCDSLVGAELVDAEGRRLICNEQENPELLWGLRGGGGNFGVVTNLQLRHHHIGPNILGGAFIFPTHLAKAVFSQFAEFGQDDNLPRELGMTCGMMTLRDFPFVPAELHWQKVCAVLFSWTGDPAAGEALVKPFADLGPAHKIAMQLPYKAFQSMVDALAPHGNRSYWKSGYNRTLPPAAIEQIVEIGQTAPSKLSQGEFVILGGAIADIPNNGTAFGDRTGRFVYNLVSTWTDPAQDAENIAWARGFFEALQPYSTDSVYVNFIGEGDDRIRAAYGDNYERLTELKARCDPDNFFRHTQNIPPAELAHVAGRSNVA